jgi:hypothetical protein
MTDSRSSELPRLFGVKLYTSKGRVFAYFRPTHTRLYADPYSEEFLQEWKSANDNFQKSRPTTPSPILKRRPPKK